MLTVTPKRWAWKKSITSSVSSVPLVVSEKSTLLPSTVALSSAYATTRRMSGKFNSASPPKKIRFTSLLSPDFLNRKSTLARAVSQSICTGAGPYLAPSGS